VLRYVEFLKSYISQGSVATRFGYGKIVNDRCIRNCRQSVPVKELSKSVNIWRRYRHKFDDSFFVFYGVLLSTVLIKMRSCSKARSC